jgi:predicted nucleic acid-binding protein
MRAEKAKVYIETSIISYLTARPSRDLIVAAHQQRTHEWWDQRRADFDLFVSQPVIQEAGLGDQQAAGKRLEVLSAIPTLALNDEATVLARTLLEARVLPEKATQDALHIAIATVHRIDYLMTWNCRHLANAEVIKQLGRVCRAGGREPPVICTPEELLGDEPHVD